MLADEFRLDHKRSSRIVASPGFRQNRDALIEALKKSLEFRGNGEELLHLQGELANSVIHAQAELRKIKRGERKFDSREVKERYKDASRALIYILKAIADGLAWRSLGYDRVAIHELAFAPQSGHMKLETALEEMTRAAQILAEDPAQIVVLNDLTNFLNYGDLTIVTEGIISIREVKSGHGAAKSGRASRQKKRLQQILQFIKRIRRHFDGRQPQTGPSISEANVISRRTQRGPCCGTKGRVCLRSIV